MRFELHHFDSRGWTATEHNHRLGQAKVLAARAVESGLSRRTEVRTEQGRLVFARPRVIRPA